MALRTIRQFENDFLHKKSREVKIIDNKIINLIDDMVETLYNTPNSGWLAACQVGILKKIAVIDVGTGLIKLINPEIIEQEGEQIVVEGCLSFPDIYCKIKRPERVIVNALNEKGEKITIESKDEMLTKCLCHEIDHLNGIIYLDKSIEIIK